jgi:hypothetical protein
VLELQELLANKDDTAGSLFDGIEISASALALDTITPDPQHPRPDNQTSDLNPSSLGN